MAVLGTIVILKRSHWQLPAWLICLIIIPREGYWLVAAPAAVLAGIGIGNYALPVFRELWEARRLSKPVSFFAKLTAVALLIIATFGPVKQVTKQLLDSHRDVFLTQAHLSTMRWVNKNVAHGSRFIVISNSNVLEWFPHITEREVLNIPYGSEWEPNESESMADLIRSSGNCQNIKCLQNASSSVINSESIFVFVDKHSSLFAEAQFSKEITVLRSEDDGLVGIMTLKH
jgi:hypothetical protein